jgi:thiol:disulfide interchange protein
MYNRTNWKGARLSLCLIPVIVLLSVFLFNSSGVTAELNKSGLVWLDYEAGLAKAGKEKKIVIVDFYTTWCRDCKKMGTTTFSDPEVVKKLQAGFVTVKVDAEARKDLSSKFGVFGYPTICVLDPNGAKVTDRTGFMDKDEFTVFLDYASTGAYKNKGFLEYYNSRRR